MNAIILLVPLFLVMIPTAVWATNEGSYKFGFSVGFSDYNHCFDNDALVCSPPANDAPLEVCVNNPVIHEVTNSTACIDGYFQGWQHWCKSDLKDCGQFTMEGRLPGALISGHNLYHPPGGSNYIRLGPKGVCPPGMYEDYTDGVLHCHGAGKTHELAPANMTNQWQRAW
jgi:hypothetical protein